jgi:hypothetical protein
MEARQQTRRRDCDSLASDIGRPVPGTLEIGSGPRHADIRIADVELLKLDRLFGDHLRRQKLDQAHRGKRAAAGRVDSAVDSDLKNVVLGKGTMKSFEGLNHWRNLYSRESESKITISATYLV